MMKKLMKRKILVTPLIAVIAVAVIGGAVYAATLMTLPGKVNIVAATYDIEVTYTGSVSADGPQQIIWKDLPVGGESMRNVYIRNLGNTNAEVVATLQGAPAGVSLKEGTDSIEIAAGQVSQFSLYLESATTAVPQSSSFTVTFTSSPVYVNP